ncbi:MAG TPA: hypothetical protein VGT41_00410 [Candidatus Babeliales bacterium]|nr:hypothetical protein [Candidatus Babeliales bacterium]
MADNKLLIFIIAFLVRAGTFQFFIQHQERYRQPDSMDYHICALGISLGTGMHRVDTKEPIFWRTPGYPAYLASFYTLYGIRSTAFNKNDHAQKAALWLQLFLCSFIPFIIFLLAYVLTQSQKISVIAAWIAVLHPGMILASCFLLTEGLAMLLFYLFLLFFYRSFSPSNNWSLYIVFAAITLGCMTWLRPMGEFVAIISSALLLCIGQTIWRQKIKNAILFLSIFFIAISGWYIRNYNLTGQLFFCPLSGPYLNAFIAPKILRDLHGTPLAHCIKSTHEQAVLAVEQEEKTSIDSRHVIVKERICNSIAWPIIIAHPFSAAYHWIKEVLKTTFDLYSYQLAAIAANRFQRDPIEEFLFTKTAACLYAQPMPPWMRIVAWIELCYAVLIWIGLIIGLLIVITHSFLQKKKVSFDLKNAQELWIKTIPLIGGILFMTGGFGYARLRLPVEPLLIILSLQTWHWLFSYISHARHYRKNQL